MSFEYESKKFQEDVERVAEQMVRDGLATPWDAIKAAQGAVMSQRRNIASRLRELHDTTERVRVKEGQ